MTLLNCKNLPVYSVSVYKYLPNDILKITKNILTKLYMQHTRRYFTTCNTRSNFCIFYRTCFIWNFINGVDHNEIDSVNKAW